jgi:hypothetical protein
MSDPKLRNVVQKLAPLGQKIMNKIQNGSMINRVSNMLNRRNKTRNIGGPRMNGSRNRNRSMNGMKAIMPVAEPAAPVSNSFVSNTPVSNTPVNNTPVYNTPVNNTPVNNTPVNNTPAYNTPVYNTPVYNTPVYNTPVNTQAGGRRTRRRNKRVRRYSRSKR